MCPHIHKIILQLNPQRFLPNAVPGCNFTEKFLIFRCISLQCRTSIELNLLDPWFSHLMKSILERIWKFPSVCKSWELLVHAEEYLDIQSEGRSLTWLMWVGCFSSACNKCALWFRGHFLCISVTGSGGGGS